MKNPPPILKSWSRTPPRKRLYTFVRGSRDLVGVLQEKVPVTEYLVKERGHGDKEFTGLHSGHVKETKIIFLFDIPRKFDRNQFESLWSDGVDQGKE